MAAILLGLVTALLAVQTLVLLHNLWYWAKRDEPRAAHLPTLSVLIPARNEIAALPRLARALAQQTFSPIEVLVYNDESTDGTAEWVRREGMRWGLRLVPTRRRPAGWVGKTWACHQLAQHARGEWMVFLDADLEPEPELLETLAGVCGVTGASLVTAIPRHTAGIWDGMVTALIPFSLFTLLVLRNAERHHHRSFAFANGQVMAMRRAEYRDLWPHRAVRDAIVEDVLIARMLKRLRLRVHVMDARPVLRVRMYRGLTDALEGFSKNASGICGGPGLAPLVAALLPVVYLLPLAPAAAGSLHALALCVWTGALVGVSCRLVGLPAWYGLVYPIPVALAEVALVRSLWWHRRGQVRWKGRVYVP